jgi:DNA-binding CsgD family transcriptional regulator
MVGDEVTRCRDLADQLITLTPGAAPALQTFVPGLRRLLGADAAAAFGLACSDGDVRLTFVYGSPPILEVGRPRLERLLRTHPHDFGAFDPRCPEPRQCNAPLLRSDLAELRDPGRLAVVQEVLVPCGLGDLDLLRVLVCDDGELLAWVGAFRRASFTAEEQRLVGGLVPALRQRLSVERQLSGAPATTAALAAALESTGAPAFVVRARDGAVAHANGSGRALLSRGASESVEALRATVEGAVSPVRFAVLRLQSPEAGSHYLVVQRSRPASLGGKAATAAERWSLTPRQREVLAELAAGASNKHVAAALGCAERTVELHVTALLGKSGCENRSELIAKFWREL